MHVEAELGRLSLREAAIQLRTFKEYSKPSSKLARSELLDLLRAGKMKASTIVPTLKQPLFDIPTSFWGKFPTEKFAEIGKGGSNNLKGVLYVSFRDDLAAHYVASVLSTQNNLSEDELFTVMTTREKSEVFIKRQEWQDFVALEGLTAQEPEPPTRGRGRPVAESWKEVLTWVAAYLVAEMDNEPPASTVAADAAIKASKEANTRVPDPATIAAQITKIYDLARDIRSKKEKLRESDKKRISQK